MRLVVLTDPHSYPRYRVNNTLQNMPEFWDAYGCKKGQKMAEPGTEHQAMKSHIAARIGRHKPFTVSLSIAARSSRRSES